MQRKWLIDFWKHIQDRSGQQAMSSSQMESWSLELEMALSMAISKLFCYFIWFCILVSL